MVKVRKVWLKSKLKQIKFWKRGSIRPFSGFKHIYIAGYINWELQEPSR